MKSHIMNPVIVDDSPIRRSNLVDLVTLRLREQVALRVERPIYNTIGGRIWVEIWMEMVQHEVNT